ncbi:MAG: tolA [Burkholderiaceae bacterium]|nr:tolA [Burkholderiaceae bacterium]
MTGAAPYSIPKEPGGTSSAVLAVVVHMLLLAFLWIGVSWQSQAPGGVEAEVWDVKYREAAPKEAEEPGPVSMQETPQPQPKPVEPVNKTPPPPVTKAVEKAPAAKPVVNRPDIALEQEKKRQAEAKKKADEDKRKKEAEAKRQKDEADKRAKREKEKADAAAKKKQDEADRKLRDKMRAEDMRRLTGTIGGAGRGGTGGKGTAARSTGDNRFEASYGDKIRAKIKSNTRYSAPAGVSGNPAVEFDVELLPDGSLRRPPRKVKSSGLPGFDEAVLRGIEKSVPFPVDKSGRVPAEVRVKYNLKD